MRILIYSHDTYGLGHLRRSLVAATAITSSSLNASVLIATGSPRAQAFALPDHCDIVKLPAILKQTDGSYRARDLDVSLEKVVAMRQHLLLKSYRDFKPDLILVDHAPLGVEKELQPLLLEATENSHHPYLVLGMRDIVDDVTVTREKWLQDGSLAAIHDIYDRVLVYGSSWMPTTAIELGLDDLTDCWHEAKVRHLGFLARPKSPQKASGRIVVTVGGGGDGATLLRAAVRYFKTHTARSRSVDIVAGPLLSERRFSALRTELDGAATEVNLYRFDPRLEDRIASAEAVIGMAGYNTVTEILRAGCPALLIPRESPRKEQLLRAERLSPVCGFSWCRASDLDDAVFDNFLNSVSTNKLMPVKQPALNGADRLVQEIGRLATMPRGTTGSSDCLKERA